MTKGKPKSRSKLPRRRAPRPSAIASDENGSPPRKPAGPDVMGLVVRTILEQVGERHDADLIVHSALRACLRQGSPQSDHAHQLAEKLDAISQRSDVRPAAFRETLNELLQIARQTREGGAAGGLVDYLAVISE